jgi:hypothetical protein
MNKKLDELEKNPRNGGVYLHNPPLEEKWLFITKEL